MSGRPLSQLFAALALLVLLAALGTLQYRWLGEVRDAERERMRANLRARAADFSEAFDRELTRIYVAFHVDSGRLGTDPAGALADAYARSQTTDGRPGLVDAVYLLEGRQLSKLHVDSDHPAIREVEWPAALMKLRDRTAPLMPDLPPVFMGEPLDATIPAVIVTLPVVKTVAASGQHVEIATVPELPTPMAVIAVLDADRLRTQVIDPLVAKYFGGDASECLVTIASRADPSGVVYTSDAGAAAVDPRGADVTAPLFSLRMDEVARLTPPARVAQIGGTTTTTTMAITIVRRGSGPPGHPL